MRDLGNEVSLPPMAKIFFNLGCETPTPGTQSLTSLVNDLLEGMFIDSIVEELDSNVFFEVVSVLPSQVRADIFFIFSRNVVGEKNYSLVCIYLIYWTFAQKIEVSLDYLCLIYVGFSKKG